MRTNSFTDGGFFALCRAAERLECAASLKHRFRQGLLMASPHVLVLEAQQQRSWNRLHVTLQGEGMHVSSVPDEEVARKVLEQGDVSLVLIMVRRIRRATLALAEVAENAGAKVVLLTEEWADVGRGHAGWQVLEMPIREEEVLAAVLTQLEIAGPSLFRS